MLSLAKISLFPDFGTFIKIGTFEIRWYAIFILTGAILSFLWCRNRLKKEGKDDTMYDNFFLWVLPIAILGARIWYVIAEWNTFKGTGLGNMINLRQGGLAIQGGVIAGIVFGIWYFRKYDKKTSVAYHTDLILPAVFIGQALGRWGNFFNQEVYGNCVSRSKLWMFPNFILDNMVPTIHTSLSSEITKCEIASEVHVPLFLIESILSIIGFVLIGIVLRKYWKKYRKPFDLSFLYLVYYGIVRTIMEPLRDPKFQMGANHNTSVILSLCFIIVGVLGMLFTRWKYKNKTYETLYVNENYVEEVSTEPVQEEKSETVEQNEPEEKNETSEESER